MLKTYNRVVRLMLVRKIKELQFLSALLLLGMLVFYRWSVVLHILAVMISIIIICNTRVFRCVDPTYNYAIIWLFLYRLCLWQWFDQWDLLSLIYILGTIVLMIILFVISFRCIL